MTISIGMVGGCHLPYAAIVAPTRKTLTESQKAADVWEKDVWEFQAKSGSSGSCCLFLYFLGKIAVQEMSGRTPGSPRYPSCRHPRPSEKEDLAADCLISWVLLLSPAQMAHVHVLQSVHRMIQKFALLLGYGHSLQYLGSEEVQLSMCTLFNAHSSTPTPVFLPSREETQTMVREELGPKLRPPQTLYLLGKGETQTMV